MVGLNSVLYEVVFVFNEVMDSGFGWSKVCNVVDLEVVDEF